jgi:KDO2-lipid IV(A) lauroyltransferase
MLNYTYYLILKIGTSILRLLPHMLLESVLNLMAKLAYYLIVEHRKYAFANLDFVYGDKLSQEEKIHIVKSAYKNLIFTSYEFLENRENSKEKITSMVSVQNDSIIKDAIKSGRNIIFITAHIGNWEIMCTYIAINYTPLTVVGRLLNNKYLNDDLVASRTKHNTKMLNKHDAARGLVAELKNGNRIGLVVDQNINEKNGLLVDFFGKQARQADSTAKLSKKFDAIIIPAFGSRQGFRNHKLEIYKIIDPRDYTSDDSVYELTQAQANIIEEHIRKYPHDWLWQHRRWKEKYPDIYNKRS